MPIHRMSYLVFAMLPLCISASLFAKEIDTELEPLIGTWKCKTAIAEVESSFRWILDRSFIEHDQTVRMLGMEHRVKELIGWDAKSQSIKGWVFSKDWIATNSYTKDGNAWKIAVVFTRKDGAEKRESKDMAVRGNVLSIHNGSAPLPEFSKLEFRRQEAAQPDRE